MKTDPLFYEMFQTAPQTFFELLQITPPCPYRFESITVKSSEKRIDGVFEPEESGQPIYFLEVQAFPDESIYWREMREIATFFEQRPALKNTPWQAFVLWLNIEDDPGFGTLIRLSRKPNPQIVSLNLLKLLKKLPKTSLALNVLRPLLAKNEREVRNNVVEWIEHIRQAPNLDMATGDRLISVLSQLIEQKFKSLNYKELSTMLRLTPLRDTTSGQELLKEDRVTILGRLIERRFSLSEETKGALYHDLMQLDLDSLNKLFDYLQDFQVFEQLEIWIGEHLQQRVA